jgi:PAS domain S-box-containing protein
MHESSANTAGARLFLSTTAPQSHEIRLALGFVLGSFVAFLVAAPFARTPLPQVPAFLPIYQSALVINDLITAVLLLGQFSILRSRPILVLASGFLFSAFMAILHALSFPGLISPDGLLGGGTQTTAWLYFLWHGAFPLFIIVYALAGHESAEPAPAGQGARGSVRRAVLLGIGAAFVLAGALTLLATVGHDSLPVIMQGDADARTKIVVASGTWALILAALVVLWRRRPHFVLDLWLTVVLWAWVFDIALAAVLNHGRYDLGWYSGRVYGLLAASFVLGVLLLENGRLYSRLAEAHAGEIRESRRVQEKSARLMTLNAELDASLSALRDSSVRLQNILDTVVDGIITVDERGTIESVNPAVEHIFGYAAAELVGTNVRMLLPEPDREQHDGNFASFRTTGDASHIGAGRELTGRRKDGSTFPMDLAVGEMNLAAERRFTGIVRDITERRAAERAVVAARIEAEQANAAKGMFLATMSHEIRTPLNGLLGMLELLGFSKLDTEQRESLEIARDSGRGLVRIIDDVLDYAKIEAGKLELRPEPVSVPQMLRRSLNTYQAVASARGLTLAQYADPRISAALLADPLRILQVLNNLVSNALKFTPRGTVEIRADMEASAAGVETIRFSVKDTGIGIAPEVQERLFRPFEQASAISARIYGGTGLGLSISRRLAELMGGSIRMESALGQGTTVIMTLTLPISKAGASEDGTRAPGAVTPLITAGERPLVLAVDDHATNRELLSRQLAMLGLRVRKAENGREALDLWRKGGVALVITDCNMPVMDGLSLARAIRDIEAAEGRPRTPLIAWTANVLPDAVTQCRAAGMDDILTKPADLGTLRLTASTWLGATDLGETPPAHKGQGHASQGNAPPIDPLALGRITLTADEHAEIVTDFLAQARTDATLLDEAIQRRDLPASMRIAHRMKGSSLMVGAQELAAACTTVVAAAQAGDEEAAAAVRPAVGAAMERLTAHCAVLFDHDLER